MRKLLKSIICLALAVLMLVPAYGLENEDNVLSDVPYDYGVVPFSEEWYSLTTAERKKIFSINYTIAKSLTTEALLDTIVSNPFIADIFAYNSIEEGVLAKENQFQFNELFNRTDIKPVLISKIEVIIGDNNYTNLLQIINNSNLKDNENLIYYLFLLDFIDENSLDTIFNNKPQRLATNGYVQTLDGSHILCSYDCDWSNHGLLAEYSAKKAEEEYSKIYSNNIKLSDRSPLYNCHSYAWHLQSTNNHVWIDSPDAKGYLSDGYCFHVGSPGVGRKIVYFKDNNIMNHSGVVDSIIGNNVYVKSKWGMAGLYKHLVADCPYYDNSIESNSNIFYYIYEK